MRPLRRRPHGPPERQGQHGDRRRQGTLLAGRSQLADRQGRVVEPRRRRSPGRAPASTPRPTPSSSAPATPARGTPGRAPPRAATRTTTTASTPPARSGVDPSSGEVKWFYQHTPTTPGTSPATTNWCCSTTRPRDGKIVKATAHADRNGFFYVVDRSNGKLQNAFPFVDNITWASHIDLKTGRPVEREGQRPPLPEPGQKHGKAVEVSPPCRSCPSSAAASTAPFGIRNCRRKAFYNAPLYDRPQRYGIVATGCRLAASRQPVADAGNASLLRQPKSPKRLSSVITARAI